MTQEQLINRMLSGVPFTYGGLQDEYECHEFERAHRPIDRAIQKLRRAGKIAYAREGGHVVWRPIPVVPLTNQPANAGDAARADKTGPGMTNNTANNGTP